jgi:cytoskeletal protein CcmA (bactofilin family)
MGALVAESRLELQSSCHVEGSVRARRLHLEEGAILNGTVEMGDEVKGSPAASAPGDTQGVQAEESPSVA